MKKILFLFIAMVSLCAQAQDGTAAPTDTVQVAFRFGYLNYDEALKAMPDYGLVQEQMATLKTQYEAEQKRVEEDFNRKYEEFLEGQREFPKTILLKRQTELQELMQKNIEFKAEVRRQLADAERQAMQPLHDRLAQVLAEVARAHGLAYVLNAANRQLPYIDPAYGQDVQAEVIAKLSE